MPYLYVIRNNPLLGSTLFRLGLIENLENKVSLHTNPPRIDLTYVLPDGRLPVLRTRYYQIYIIPCPLVEILTHHYPPDTYPLSGTIFWHGDRVTDHTVREEGNSI